MEPYIENQFHPQSHPSNSGLLRFRSAPGSLLSSVKGYDFIHSATVDSDESTPIYLSTGGGGGGDSSPHSFEGDGESKQVKVSQNGYSGFRQNQLPPQYPKGGLVMEGSFKAGDGLSLTRQSSSPAGFFSHLNAQNGYGLIGGIGNFKAAGSSNGGGELSPNSSRLKAQIDFASGLSTSIGHLPRIPEIGAETTKGSSPDGGGGSHSHGYRNGEEDARFYNPGFSFTSWNDPNTSGPKRIDKSLYSVLDVPASQNGAFPYRAHILPHHLSLPKTSAEMAAVEKLLNFQDTVPCKIRAKRGCATHPRSIAERVRRTRISDRMKKLQELVPNMEKQVNTSDMLDLAVEYIKDLQKQYKRLSDSRARCKCLHVQQSAVNRAS